MHNKKSVFINIPLPYDPNIPADPEIWDSNFYPILLHGSIEHLGSDVKSIKDSLRFMTKYITNKQIESSKANDLKDFKGIGEAVWNFISSIYEANWDVLYTDNKSVSLRRKIASKFTPKMPPSPQKNNKKKNGPSLANINRLLPPITAKSPKKVNEISKFFKNNKTVNFPTNKSKSYAQASKQNMSTADVIKIKETFPLVGVKEINQINNIIKEPLKPKLHIQMTTKGPSRKQVIIPIVKDNIDKFMKNSLIYVANLNRNLKNAKSEVSVDYIHSDILGIIVVTNSVLLNSDLLIIEKYVKNLENIDSTQVETLQLPQSKSYLKIISILYYPHGSYNSQEHITSNNVEDIIKQNYIFDDITLASKPRVIKVLPKSDIAIAWIDIWDIQSGVKAKGLINQCFNIRRYIAMIRMANTNTGIPQCKNC